MATSSITRNVIISGEKEVAAFAAAIEDSANAACKEIDVPVTFVKGPEAVREFLKKRGKWHD